MERRQFLQAMGLAGVAGVALGGGVASAAGGTDFELLPKSAELGASGRPTFTLPPLPYEANALEPVLSAAVMQAHHDKGEGGYVAGLNKTLGAIQAAIKAKDTAHISELCSNLAYMYGGHLLHGLYFYQLNKAGAKTPEGELANAINRDFGSFGAMKAWLAAAADAVHGSGWAVLAWDPMGDQLVVAQTAMYENTVPWGMVPLVTVDVWEHAYMHDYGLNRPAYVNALLGIVDWSTIGKRFSAARTTTV